MGIDTVLLGDKDLGQLVIKKTTFGQMTQIPSYYWYEQFDGVLGLAFQSIAIDDVKPVFKEAVDQGLVDQSIFTVWLKSDGENSNGQVGGKSLILENIM